MSILTTDIRWYLSRNRRGKNEFDIFGWQLDWKVAPISIAYIYGWFFAFVKWQKGLHINREWGNKIDATMFFRRWKCNCRWLYGHLRRLLGVFLNLFKSGLKFFLSFEC